MANTDLDQLTLRLRVFAAERGWNRTDTPKALALAVLVESAELLEHFQWLAEAESSHLPAPKRAAVEAEMADVLIFLLRLADTLAVDPLAAAQRKMALNALKYPAERARGRATKYDELQVDASAPTDHADAGDRPPMIDLQDLTHRLRRFAAERDWERFHSPKNVAMALTVEAAELMEHFQWRSEDEAVSPSDLAHVEQEIADVLIYLVRLADRLDTDLIAAVQSKMALNAQRFPIAGAGGSTGKQ